MAGGQGRGRASRSASRRSVPRRHRSRPVGGAHPPGLEPALEAAFRAVIGRPVVLYLDNPREKVWGLLIQIGAAGVLLRGLDLAVFDDWLRQEARRGEAEVALTTVFYPMARVARMELDETSGQIPSCAERFLSAVGRSVYDVLGVESPEESSASGRRRSLR